jgi:hypothetical protein
MWFYIGGVEAESHPDKLSIFKSSIFKNLMEYSQAPVVQACNPSYLRD